MNSEPKCGNFWLVFQNMANFAKIIIIKKKTPSVQFHMWFFLVVAVQKFA